MYLVNGRHMVICASVVRLRSNVFSSYRTLFFKVIKHMFLVYNIYTFLFMFFNLMCIILVRLFLLGVLLFSIYTQRSLSTCITIATCYWQIETCTL